MDRNPNCEVGDCANCKQSIGDCDGVFKLWVRKPCNVGIKSFKPYFDVTLAKEVTSEKEIKEYCAKNNCVYAGDKEISQQCAINKRRNEEKFNKEFKEKLTEKLMSI